MFLNKVKKPEIGKQRILLLVLAYLMTGPVSGQTPPPGHVFLTWEEVNGASGYLVNVKNPLGRLEVDRRIQENKLDFFLPVGDYLFRVAAIDPFGHPGEWSAWRTLRVRPTGTPQVEKQPSLFFEAGEGPEEITLRGKNIFPQTRAFLVGGGGELIPLSVHHDGDSLVISFTPTAVGPGRHDVILENPGGLRTTMPALIEIRGEVSLQNSDPSKIDQRKKSIFPQIILPGFPDISKGDKKGFIWMSVFGLLSSGAYAQWSAEERLTRSTQNDLFFQLFQNPVYYLAIRQSFSGNSALWPLAVLSYVRGKDQIDLWKKNERNKILLGEAAIAIWTMHFMYVFSHRQFYVGGQIKLESNLPLSGNYPIACELQIVWRF